MMMSVEKLVELAGKTEVLGENLQVLLFPLPIQSISTHSSSSVI
jgi:hypothetical protein